MKRILITGGAGFIGNNLAKNLKNDYEVYILDNHFPGFGTRTVSHVNIINGDVRIPEQVDFATTNINTVIHLAAISHVTACKNNPKLAFDVNVRGTINVLDACVKNGVDRVIVAGTDHVYGSNLDMNELPVLEHHSYAGIKEDVYAVTKTMSVELTSLYHRLYDLDTITTFSGNVFGYGQSKPNAIPNFIDAALKNEEIIIHGNGLQTRDFYHVDNLVSGYRKCIEAPKVYSGHSFNFGGEKEISIKHLAEKIVEMCESKSRIIHDLSTAAGMKRMSLDISKAKNCLGYNVIVPFEEGLQKTIDLYRLKFW